MIAFIAGGLSTQLTLFLSDALKVEELYRVPYIGGHLLFYVVGVGLVEEGAKAFWAFVTLKTVGFAQRPLLSLQLCGAVALGFATVENVLYARNYGDGVLLGRFVFSTLGHVLFASVWGFALGRGGGKVVQFLMLSSLGHGLYDWFLVTDRAVLSVLCLVVLWLGFREAVLGAFLHQEYSRGLPFALETCPECTVHTRAEGNFCSFCGASLRSLHALTGDDGTALSGQELEEDRLAR